MRLILVLSVLFTVGYAAPQYPAARVGDKYLPPSGADVLSEPIISKKFYIVSAPQENEGKSKNLVLGRPQKTYRVVFIKAPVGENDKTKYAAEFAPNEEKTVIYVLTKKDRDINAEDIVTPAPIQPSKPEIFFIKYKTEEEAQHAQKEIQAEYDKLGGTNEVSDEGQAPVTSVIGSLDSLNPDGSYNYKPVSSGSASLSQPLRAPAPTISTPSSQYLPSIFKV